MRVGDRVRSKIGSTAGKVEGIITAIVRGWNGNLYAEIDRKIFYPVRLLEKGG